MENEIKRLQLLKTLQVERERLAEMIAMKNKVSISFAQHISISISTIFIDNPTLSKIFEIIWSNSLLLSIVKVYIPTRL